MRLNTVDLLKFGTSNYSAPYRYFSERVVRSICSLWRACTLEWLVSFPDPTPTRGKGSGVLRAISWASRMQNSHVILIIVMATHCLVCGSRMQQHCGLICAAGALSHEKSHAVNLIGAPEIRTATSSSPRNRSKYTRPSSLCRGGVWDRD